MPDHRPRHPDPLRRRLAALALVLAPALAAAAAADAPGPEVPVVKAAGQAVAVGFEFDGVIEPVKQSTVSAQASGRVIQLAVTAGDRVRAGQLLATIDDRESQAGLQRSQAQVAQAEAELRNAQANERRTRELQSKGFVSKAALDTAEAGLKSAQAAREQAVAGQRQSALAQGFTRVTAPYDGWVRETLAQAGDLAVPGKPLLTVYAPQPLRAVVHVPMSRGAAARAAGQVEVRLPGGNGQAAWIKPVQREVLPVADAVAQTVEWRLELPPAAAGQLAPGQQVRVRFSGSEAVRMLVPASAILRRGELTAVYVASAEGAFVLKAVRLGADHGAAGVEIVAGLRPEDRVAIDPVRAGLAGARAGTR
ncbi:efflux RND transporter periplasmic adaptor subunit [Ramlibacter sp.]|uniref:efflux RND transporter periplasmic adaptor subunit n=1 Tax=Ramlibacter sp. TaxID=1917967 RepID=UPI002BD81137|nr:efflux RND transporter periplasmic adaptor subunit [Ramlibacter sp.]HWI82025.1 efflux RND transporter periplasmic adaptor subunit [Ramlibacter sp.]